MCQSVKNYIKVQVGKLIVNEILEKPWTHLMIDFITKLLLVAEKNAILALYNRLSKIAHFVTTTEETLAEGLVWLFRNNI